MATKVYQGKKQDGDLTVLTEDSLTEEAGLQIIINDKPFSITMRTPGQDEELIRGLLHAEGIINARNFHPDITFSEAKKAITSASMSIPEEKLGNSYSNHRSLLSVSSCGICGKTELDDHHCEEHLDIESDRFDARELSEMFQKMEAKQKAFISSGGSHAAAVFSEDGEIICLREDIGRHNAVDKVVGHLLLKDRLKDAKFLLVSGRISYEIVIKCFKARIPILAAVSAPSTLAVDYAKELGITLIGFARKNRSTCYANTQRLTTNQHKTQSA
jgi:FdhD protein